MLNEIKYLYNINLFIRNVQKKLPIKMINYSLRCVFEKNIPIFKADFFRY